MVLDLEIRMPRQPDVQKQITRRTAADSRFPASSEAELLSIGDAGRNPDLALFSLLHSPAATADRAGALAFHATAAAALTRHGAVYRDRANRPTDRLLQRDH